MTIKYEIIDHTADIGLRIIGSDLKELFQNSGLSLFQISSRKQFTKDKRHTPVVIKQKAENIEELFINWLNELLSLSAVKGLIFYHIKINKITEQPEAICQSSINNYKVNTEIKAATYHNLSIKNNEKGWEARVILDV